MLPTGRLSRKRRGAIWLLLTLILLAGAAGCAPADQPLNEDVLLETLIAEAVETQRVENLPDTEPSPDPGVVATLTAAAEQPAVLAAQTLTPTITPTLEFTATPRPDLPTMPPIPTMTLPAPEAPDRNPGDPALRLGEPDWQDPFDNADNWTEYTGQNSQIEITDGQFRITMFEPSAVPTWWVSWPQVSNFYAEVLAVMPPVCEGKDRIGWIFRSPDPAKGYRLEISCDGQYRMLVFDEDGAEVVVAWSSSEYLLGGPNQINRLGIWAQGKVLQIHLNGVAVAGLEHNDHRTGTFGFSVTSENTPNFTAAFDDLTFWTFP